MLLADRLGKQFQSLTVELAFRENPTRYDYMRCTCIQIFFRILGSDAAADLQSAGIGGERFFRGFGVALAEHNHVAALDSVFLIEFRKPSGGTVRFEIRLEASSAVIQRTAYNLLYTSVVQVDAGAKLCH